MNKICLIWCLLFISSNIAAQVPNYVSPNGLIAYYPFDANANDVSGNGNNGDVNGASLTDDRYNVIDKAYFFPSTACATYIGANINTTSVNASGAMSLSYWVMKIGDGCLGPRVMEFGSCTTCAGQILVTWGNGSNTMTLRHYLDAASPVSYDYNNLTINTWYHIVYTNDGTNAKFYLNGALMSTKASPVKLQLQGNTAFGRMNHPDNDAFFGKLDDIGVWNRALTSCEVQALYTGNTSSGFTINPFPDTTLKCGNTVLDAGAGYNSYQWSTGATSRTITPTQKGWYKVAVTNSNGCIAMDSTYLKSIIAQGDTGICSGSSLTLSSTISGGSGAVKTLVDQFVMDVTAPFSHPVNATTPGVKYTMIVTGTMADHCDDFNMADAAFYINRTPQANNKYDKWTFDGGTNKRPDIDVYDPSHRYEYTITQGAHTVGFTDDPYTDNCGGPTFEVYAETPPVTVTYLWSTGATTPSINVSPTTPTAYWVTVTKDGTACTDTVKVSIASVDTSITVDGSPKICQGGGVTMHAGVSNAYKWLLNGNAIPSATSKDLTATQTGNYSVITGSGTCVDTSRAINITLYPQPVARFSIDDNTQCINTNKFVFTDTSKISSGALQQVWNFGDGNVANNVSSASHSYTAADTYNVNLISISDNGCKDSVTHDVTVHPLPATPTITANGPVSVCYGDDLVLSSNAASGNQWYDNGSLISDASLQIFAVVSSGVYTVITTSNDGCNSSPSNVINVTVTPSPPKPVITPNGSVVICQNESVLLSSDAVTGDQWYKNGTAIANATGQTYSVVDVGRYSVIVTNNNCSSPASDETIVTIGATTATPTISTNDDVSFCGTGTVTITSSASTGNQWYSVTTPIAGATAQTYAASSTGAYSVIATDLNSCPSAPSNTIEVNISLPVKNTRYPTINTSVSSPIALQARTFGDSYTWMPGTGLSDPTSAAPVFSAEEETEYIIRITTLSGCVTYDSLLVRPFRIKGIIIPTAFSPNNDGLNDVLRAFLIDVKELRYFRIYNKWGQLLFESNDPARGWDGTYNGQTQATGAYVWIAQGIDKEGKILNERGQVVLVR